MSKACELLKTSDKKIYEIAELTGFREPGYFNVIFKKTLNVYCLFLKENQRQG